MHTLLKRRYLSSERTSTDAIFFRLEKPYRLAICARPQCTRQTEWVAATDLSGLLDAWCSIASHLQQMSAHMQEGRKVACTFASLAVRMSL